MPGRIRWNRAQSGIDLFSFAEAELFDACRVPCLLPHLVLKADGVYTESLN